MPDVILKDRDGNDVPHEGVSAVELVTADGGVQQFVAGEIVEKTVNPDFSGGDMEVAAGEGEFLSKVTFQHPITLVPENIAEGVDVAGIVGSLKAGGGKFKGGFFIPNATYDYEITHNLGVVPDIIFAIITSTTTSGYSTGKVVAAYGFSANITGTGWLTKMGMRKYATQKSTGENYTVTDETGIFHDANETTIKFGTSANTLNTSAMYSWFAIGGLT